MPFDPAASARFIAHIERSRSELTDRAIVSRREQRKLRAEGSLVVASPVEEPAVHAALAVGSADGLSGDATASTEE